MLLLEVKVGDVAVTGRATRTNEFLEIGMTAALPLGEVQLLTKQYSSLYKVLLTEYVFSYYACFGLGDVEIFE